MGSMVIPPDAAPAVFAGMRKARRSLAPKGRGSLDIPAVLDCAGSRKHALVVVAADHETGGLTVMANRGRGNWPEVTWRSGDHTIANVKLYATGPGSELIGRGGVMENTEVYRLLMGTIESAANQRATSKPGAPQPSSRPVLAEPVPASK